MAQNGFVAGASTLLAITAVFVAVRLWVNIAQSKKLFIDDYLSVIALGVVAVSVAYNCLSSAELSTPRPNMLRLAEIAYVLNFVGSYALFLSKTPILYLYIRLFGLKNWVRVVCYLTLFATFCAFFIGTTISAVVCSPKEVRPACLPTITAKGTYLGAVAIAADVIIIIVPLPVVLRLNLSLHKRIGLAIVFLAGIFATGASVVSLVYKNRASTGDASTMVFALLCATIECCVAIMVGCAPMTAAFWTKFITQTALYARIESKLSQITLRRVYGDKSSRATDKPQAESTKSLNVGPYVSLDESHGHWQDPNSDIESGKAMQLQEGKPRQ
jgi:hypothetical protein